MIPQSRVGRPWTGKHAVIAKRQHGHIIAAFAIKSSLSLLRTSQWQHGNVAIACVVVTVLPLPLPLPLTRTTVCQQAAVAVLQVSEAAKDGVQRRLAEQVVLQPEACTARLQASEHGCERGHADPWQAVLYIPGTGRGGAWRGDGQ